MSDVSADKSKGGRPRRGRGASTTADGGGTRWTIRGVPEPARALARKGAKNRGLTLGDWVSEAIVNFSRSAGSGVLADENLPAPPELTEFMETVRQRLDSLENQGFMGRFFGGHSKKPK